MRSSAVVNHYYFYCVDRDFGPFFIKCCSYFPYTGKVCLNVHEYVKRQIQHHGIAFEALDGGILSCSDPERLQRICDSLTPAKIDALVRKSLRRLPHAFTPSDRRAGYRYELAILQAEFSLTQTLDRPVTGRLFFEQIIRHNPRQHRHRPPRSRATDLQPPYHAPNSRPIPYTRDHRRAHPVAACGLQAHPHQAVPQGGQSRTN